MLIYYVWLSTLSASGIPYPKDLGYPNHLTICCTLYLRLERSVLSCSSEDNHMEPCCVIPFPEEAYVVLAVSQVLL